MYNYVPSLLNLSLAPHQPSGSSQIEAMHINKSLSFLEQVVVALADKHRQHMPYRQSKLTHLLKDSLGADMNILLCIH